MRLFIGLLAYLIGSAALALSAVAIFVVLAEPAVTSLARPESRAVAPRIQAWLDREAEAIVYGERARATSLAEEERWKALAARIRIPTAADYAALAEQGHALQREVSARTSEEARRKPLRQAPRLREAQQVPPVQPPASQQQYPDIHARIY